jgi:Protein of unknown function (DUF5818)
MMKLIKLTMIGVSASALILASAQAWASSTVANAATPMPVIQEPQAPPSQAKPDQAQPNPDSARSSTFTGIVMKDGEQYVLRDSSASVYKLDDSSRAQSFEGKTVKVTGQLDPNSKLIHVDTIEAAAS